MQVGYCPQRDPLLELLTPREHLQLYARIKGVPERNLSAVVDAKLKVRPAGRHVEPRCSNVFWCPSVLVTRIKIGSISSPDPLKALALCNDSPLEPLLLHECL